MLLTSGDPCSARAWVEVAGVCMCELASNHWQCAGIGTGTGNPRVTTTGLLFEFVCSTHGHTLSPIMLHLSADFANAYTPSYRPIYRFARCAGACVVKRDCLRCSLPRCSHSSPFLLATPLPIFADLAASQTPFLSPDGQVYKAVRRAKMCAIGRVRHL
jgi:hypothetical protein